MRVLHLAAGNRWTGAAAPAFAEVEALRAAGIEAHYAYVGGYKLEQKIGHLDFAHAIIEKAQNPAAFLRSVSAVRRLIVEKKIDVVHAHLTYDHWLARFAGRGAMVARTFHARRVLRTDPLSRRLNARTQLLFVINDCFRDTLPQAVFTPPPIDHRQFHADGPSVRAQYGIPAETKLVTVIGKVSKGRGFEDALQTFAQLRRTTPAARLMIIGHGEHRPALEKLAGELAITDHVLWAGYHEDDLAEHYRASDLLLFTARGSDEGHRAVLEAMACGVPPASFPIEGVSALTGPLSGELIAPDSTPGALAATVARLLGTKTAELRSEVSRRSQEFGYRRAAERLREHYGRAVDSPASGN
jgi:glycosyltransferase involved in cell wall biosynthesis